jgi:uncharacterized OB-fold protein
MSNMDKEQAQKGKVPEIPGLFEWTEDGVRLRSAKCNSCGTYFFPEGHQQHRVGCSREGVEKVLLSNKGKLASYTIQHYMCPPPFRPTGDITPYGIGLVEFPEERIQCAGLIMESDLKALKIGQNVETITYTLRKDEEGQEVVTWAFRVVG